MGDQRVGLAVSDPTQTLGTPLKPERRQNYREWIKNVIEKENIVLILVGMPYLPSGKIGTQAKKTKSFIGELSKTVTVPIKEIDERMSSIEALNLLRQSPGYKGKRKRDKGTLDSASATVLLQHYLDTKKLRI